MCWSHKEEMEEILLYVDNFEKLLQDKINNNIFSIHKKLQQIYRVYYLIHGFMPIITGHVYITCNILF